MKLLFKQRMFSWFDSYDIYYENGRRAYTVKGQLSWGHRLNIMDKDGRHIGTVKEKVLRLLPRFELYENGEYIGDVAKEFTLFRPSYYMEFNGWYVEGNVFGWDYSIEDRSGNEIAYISKEIFRLSDTYVIDVVNEGDALYALMFTLAIDAEKCSNN